MSLILLIILGLAWELNLAPLRIGGSYLALKVLPLCIPVVGILKDKLYTYRYLSLFIWLYVMEACVRLWSDVPRPWHRVPSTALAWIELLLCLIIFAACALHVRTYLKHHQK